MSRGKKLTLNFVRNSFELEGYVLLTDVYENARQKLLYICPNGHHHAITWYNWFKGKRCYYCNKWKFSIDIVRKAFELEGYELLSKVYHNTETKLRYVCNNNHRHSITWQKWQQGRRCPVCFFIRYSGPGHPFWKGGISCEPYCDIWASKEYKESIKDRDGYRCQNPRCRKNSIRLVVHHVDYNKKNCHPWNLITLCNSCNGRANRNRKWHTIFYREILLKRGLYDVSMACMDDRPE